jgi:hypothetical protein
VTSRRRFGKAKGPSTSRRPNVRMPRGYWNSWDCQ